MDYNKLLTDSVHAIGWIVSNWQTIGAYSIGGVTIGTLAHKVERSRGYKDLQKLGYTIVALAALAGTLGVFALHAHTSAANWHVIPKNLGYLTTATLFLRRFVVSGAFEKIALKLTKFSGAVKQLEELEQQATTPVHTDNQFVA